MSWEECQNVCNTTQSFCGICENGQDCIEFAGIANCAATTVCVLPNGSFAFNLTDSECNSYGQCSHTCAPRCQSSKVGQIETNFIKNSLSPELVFQTVKQMLVV